jgi:hypothetical protein
VNDLDRCQKRDQAPRSLRGGRPECGGADLSFKALPAKVAADRLDQLG